VVLAPLWDCGSGLERQDDRLVAEGEGEIARMEKLVALAVVFVVAAFVGVYALAAWKGQNKPK
jgi:hypothetical protein